MTMKPPEDGVRYEDGLWVAYVDGALVASGPDTVIVQAAFDYHDTEDEG